MPAGDLGEVLETLPARRVLSACADAASSLTRIVKGREFDIEGFVAAVELLVLAQDAIVDGSGYPSEQIERNAHRLRQIGIGYANLAALLLTQRRCC